jgi:oligopeptide transport system substrate-binding protein
MALLLMGIVAAQGEIPLTLHMDLAEPITLDPSRATDTTSHRVIEQLFIGLVDLDDETAAVRPELATGWTVSSDDTVYTFTLRSDATWSDGRPVTAQDARYGILRSLGPEGSNSAASLLSIIRNAEAYHTGVITDPNEVGVTAVNTTTLRVALEHPAAYALSLLASAPARPLPQWAIEAHGTPTWTLPANIVTSGAYRLSEWVHEDHILLDKNPAYYDAANVQIERVKMWIVDADTAWDMYLNGQLDTMSMPLDAPLDPIPRREVHTQPIACTYVYGFSTSQPPFTSTLVRKAFAATVDRQALISTAIGGPQLPALTLTPPGVFGHVDGAAEGIGLPYDPAHARQWLAQAGYPNGEGLPSVTLWFNESPGHQAIAEYARESWYATLGVSVTLESLPWSEYINRLNEGQFQISRMGWCMDYPDANYFLNDAVMGYRGALGNWDSAEYDDLVSQAAREQDPNARVELYKQAEEILVETDAVMAPLYYYASSIASKPYLNRTYGTVPFDISTWRIWRLYLPLVLRT